MSPSSARRMRTTSRSRQMLPPLERRKRRVRKEIARTDERPDPPARVHAHRRAMPLERAREQLVVQRDHLAVAAEQMVVVALHENAAADVERAGLAADVGPALV